MGQTYPRPIQPADVVVANANAGKPRHYNAADWAGGATGDERQATATVALANSSGGVNEANYSPRTHADKATLLGQTVVTDIARPRGWLQDDQPYSAMPAAPVVSSIAPTTGAQTTLPLLVTITGTGFSPWSTVLTGGQNVPDPSGKYVSPTKMTVPIWAAAPGTVSVAVKDHDVLSNTDKLFTVT